ncbi:MAG: uL15 family ribosomal protein [Methanosarcina vacuolata]|jgi:large subunit ribosomal protein L15|uniref:Large ribosomal subunit protein uL15 n=1 Tax=Methanosarcina vacuolata Z-761 TaxID=1434123 RepID=A0A0E3Q4B4_9EURY|nr:MULTISPECIES: uL15 family ribosomal protein [Methanosarcina]AKB43142.1 LSU ribosomal protein L27Ae (L15p) [Methanosarcina vacuolata Z-761]AKB46619.1 LSU ribosomal protein L27Ae (L15p) [Methanosarcina sp. Kolksee]MCC4767918.1 50S ribosomal protein L15 [Methanosarcina sp. DH1]MDY0128641.1 uL15 family ribosomal protein [Methanosarcina vacuolata]
MDTKKFRGSRTCGGGTHKNRRGAGNRGGRGKAGGCKHHFVRAMLRGYSYGKHGFKLPAEISRDVSIVNVGELDELAPYLVEEGLAEIKDGAYHINLENLEIEKVLGSGRVTKNLVVTSEGFSASAREKIEAAGGSCIDAE